MGTVSRYQVEPFSEWEHKKIAHMVENGATLDGAWKSRLALRRKKRVLQVKEKDNGNST